MLLLVGALVVVAAVAITAGVWLGANNGGVTAAPQGRLDVVIAGGTVFDGTGSAGRLADVGVRDGRIVAVGDLDGVDADRTVDASGRYVTPGFIDLHSHAELDALADAKSSLTQGVTTEAIGPDGMGRADIAAQFDELDGIDTAINLAPYIGFNTVWTEVVGEADVRPTAEQSARMQAMFAQAMSDGAWGVSSGLGYFPARYSTTDEVAAAIGDLAGWRAMFSDHMRDETNHAVEAVEENLRIGAATGLMAEATHMKVAGPGNWGGSAEMLALQADARADGRLAGGDVYPYTAASTGLSFYIPGWAQDGGTEAMLDRFDDPASRARIDQEVSAFVVDDVGEPANITFPVLGNASLADLMVEYGDVTIGEAVMRTLAEHGGDIPCVMQIGSEDDLEAFLTDPFLAISSDGGATESDETHPRHYGTYPRVLGRYVREQGVLSWEEAIRKITGLPATMLGMVDRGFIAPGMAADLTVFDPERIIDRATFPEPKQYSEGVELVFVNGELALEDGEPTGAAAGEALRRSPGMPTRPQDAAEAKRVTTEGIVELEDGAGELAVDLSLEQTADAPGAVGGLSVTTPEGEPILTGERLGLVQSAEGWWSVTGVGRVPGGEERSFVLIVDEHDPLAGEGETRVTLRVDGSGDRHGTLSPR
ncbi:amidohydrolase family protein [Agromyces sp. NPDC058126]|uniref:N-acyl-D-amino-acid deacylase family protein n=1 Tax=Agromyces sp. NPDC058126 TaxID=3346350 RepID=UPI0036DC22C8